jgi:hypothetical protein
MTTRAVRTPCTPTEALHAVWQAHQNVIGGPCPVALLELVTAQSALETGRWHSMWCWNMGNIRGKGSDGTITIAGADEIIDGHRVTGPSVEAGFAAYRGLVDGAEALVRFLGTASHPGQPNRYQAAWDAACRGDVAGFVHGMKHPAVGAGYFTADEALYARGVEGTLAWLRSSAVPEFLRYLSPAQGAEPFPPEVPK